MTCLAAPPPPSSIGAPPEGTAAAPPGGTAAAPPRGTAATPPGGTVTDPAAPVPGTGPVPTTTPPLEPAPASAPPAASYCNRDEPRLFCEVSATLLSLVALPRGVEVWPWCNARSIDSGESILPESIILSAEWVLLLSTTCSHRHSPYHGIDPFKYISKSSERPFSYTTTRSLFIRRALFRCSVQ